MPSNRTFTDSPFLHAAIAASLIQATVEGPVQNRPQQLMVSERRPCCALITPAPSKSEQRLSEDGKRPPAKRRFRLSQLS